MWPHVRDGIEEMAAIAAEARRPFAHLALRWLVDWGLVASVLVGSRSAAHLTSNLAAFQGVAAPSVIDRLNRASRKVHRHIPRVGNIFKHYP